MHKWSGCHLRIAYKVFPPWVVPYQNGKRQVRFHGLVGALVATITQAMNMTYEAVETPDGTFGFAYGNGNYTGSLAMAFNGHADVALGPFPQHEYLHPDLTLLPAFILTEFRFLQGMQRPFITKPTSFFGVFDALTWLLMCVSFLTVVLLQTLDTKPMERNESMINRIADRLFEMFAIWLQESAEHKFIAGWARFLGAIWLLITLVISQSFGSNLKANSMIRQPTLRINSVRDLVKHKDRFTLIYAENTPLIDILMKHPGKAGDGLREMVANGRGTPLENYFSGKNLEDTRHGTAVFAVEYFHVTDFLISECPTTKFYYYLSANHIQHVIPSPIFGPHVDKKLVEDFAQRIRVIASMKVPFPIQRKSLAVRLTCLIDNSKSSLEIKELSFKDLQFTFSTYLVGLTGSLLVLLIEALFACFF